jgi:ABC-type transport system involved in multi-copper enzyme maturation permease subunit
MIVRQNPIVLKELRARMRGRQASILLTAYLGVLALLVILVYLVFRSSSSATGSANDLRMLGKTIFGLIVGVEFLAVCFIAPGLTAGAISGERERQTLDLLRTTLLTARGLVFGKFFAALSFLVLLLFTALPVQSLAFLFGGVAVEEVLVGALLLFVTAMTFCAAGMVFQLFHPNPDLHRPGLRLRRLARVWITFPGPGILRFAQRRLCQQVPTALFHC